MPSAPKTKIVAAFRKRPSNVVDIGTTDATFEFAAETPDTPVSRTAVRTDRGRLVAGSSLVVVVIALITAGVYWKDRWQLPAAAAGGSLRIESDPPGAEVRLNGTAKGITPLSLSMPAGSYSLAVQRGSSIKELPVSISNVSTTIHHITWAVPAAPTSAAAEVGNLSITTEPSGSEVVVDGQLRGNAPITLSDLPVGQHRVVVRANGTTHTRTVQVEAGATASLFFGGSTQVAAVPGSIAIASPVPVQIFEDRRLIGTSDMDRILLPAGEHVIELVADSVGYRGTRTVTVMAGQTAALAVDLPQAPLSINAIPWAEVSIDGTRIGETPLGNLPQTLGAHEVVFRHPQLGERRVNVMVTTKEPARISVDMRQQ